MAFSGLQAEFVALCKHLSSESEYAAFVAKVALYDSVRWGLGTGNHAKIVSV